MIQETEWALLLGRFHPIILHLPIALILLVAVMELCPDFKHGRKLHGATMFVWSIAASSAILAAILGWLLASSGEYSEELLERHRWLGVGVAVMAVICLGLKWIQLYKGLKGFSVTYYIALSINVLVLTIASHDGGSLTHGKDFLTYYLPDNIKELIAPRQPEPTEQEVAALDTVYHQHIAPILEAHCTDCHGAEKSKGKLRLDSPEWILQGGKEGESIDMAHLSDSPLLTRLLLPETDENVMPPEGKRRMDSAEIEAIRWWLEGGASFELSANAFDPELASRVQVAAAAPPEAIVEPPAQAAKDLLSSEALETALTALQAEGFVAKLISAQSPDVRVEVSLARPHFSAQHLLQLAELKDHLTDLDLSRTSLTGIDLTPLAKLHALQRLNMSQCEITESAVPVLYQLKALEYLNLYGNEAISDVGASLLATLPELKQLYLWQTDVSAQTGQLLTQINPELRVEIEPDYLNGTK